MPTCSNSYNNMAINQTKIATDAAGIVLGSAEPRTKDLCVKHWHTTIKQCTCYVLPVSGGERAIHGTHFKVMETIKI